MNRKVSILVLLLAVVSFMATPVMAQMTDEAVYAYVKEGLANGKTQDELITELVAKGVTKEQAQRIKNSLQAKGATTAIREAGVQERMRRMTGTMGGLDKDALSSLTDKINEVPDSLFVDGKEKQITIDGKVYVLQEEKKDTIIPIFGHNIFTNPDLTFEPNENLATPENYKLGAGDEVIVDIWGASQTTIRQVISPDGFINVEGVGLIYLTGMKISEAEGYVRKQLNKIYSIDGEGAKSDIKLTLGALRTIQVNVMGEVKVPGTYFLSSLSSVYHALYRAGGFTDLGSLRNIQLIRNGKTMTEVDVYDFLIKGKASEDVILQDGDIVLVPTYEMVVDAAGKVKRPMKYEMKDGESVKALLDFAGGFRGDAYKGNVNIVRRNGSEYQVYTVDSEEYATFPLMDTDSLTVGEVINRYVNRVDVEGAVYRPGSYQLSEKINTVSKLIEVAAGLKGDAFLDRAIIHRERKDLTLEVVSVNLRDILNGTSPDVELQENDILYISSIHDIKDLGIVTVNGEVARPGDFVFAENMTIEDVIMQAGGLLESASTVKIDVSRRVKDTKAKESSSVLAELHTIEMKDGYVVDGNAGFVLQPFDVVYVRRSPNYHDLNQVNILGEVLFPGDYSLAKKNTRLSDLIEQAGGISDWAYVKGARLSRKMTVEEKARVKATLSMLDNTRDSLDLSGLEESSRYFVGIDLEAALANPGCDADIFLRDGDNILIPEYINSIKISGNVLYPNVVSYNSNMTVKDYVEMAGGYGFDAKKNRAYIVYINGTVARARKHKKGVVEPGCEIIVPQKYQKEGSLEKILSVATTSSSVATMLATVGNIILNATR